MLLKPQPQFVVYWVVQAKGVQNSVLVYIYCGGSREGEGKKETTAVCFHYCIGLPVNLLATQFSPIHIDTRVLLPPLL